MATHPEQSRPPRPQALAVLATAAFLALALGLSACGDTTNEDSAGSGGAVTTAAEGTDDYGGTTGSQTEGSTVVAKDFSLTSITVAPGTEVSFKNEGKVPHTLTADDGSFDSGNVTAASTGSVTAPDEPGDYAFHCEIHPAMTGTLTVEG